MPIKFDTLDELKAFYRAFTLSGEIDEEALEAPKKRGRKPGAKSAASSTEAPKKRGRKPGVKAATAAKVTKAAPAKRGRKPVAKVTSVAETAKKRGRKPGVKAAAVAKATKAAPAKRGRKPASKIAVKPMKAQSSKKTSKPVTKAKKVKATAAMPASQSVETATAES